MDKPQAETLAAAINVLRPDWPVRQIVNLLAKHRQRPFADVAIALTAIAVDPATRTPARLHEDGPWWKAAHTARAGSSEPPTWTPARTRNECPHHPGQTIRRCSGCAADQKAQAA